MFPINCLYCDGPLESNWPATVSSVSCTFIYLWHPPQIDFSIFGATLAMHAADAASLGNVSHARAAVTRSIYNLI